MRKTKDKNQRPPYVLESHEDEVYHESLRHKQGPRGNEPEYYAFLEQSAVFNRALQWRDADNGTLICFDTAGALPLTGERQVSEWFTEPANRIFSEGEATVFLKQAPVRQRDCVVLPCFQFNLEQHPRAVLNVMKAGSDWQFCVLIKGRSGAPLISSGWQSGARKMSFDLAAALKNKGYNLHFAELYFVLGVWTNTPVDSARIKFVLTLPGRGAVVPCLPVIRSIGTVKKSGVPVSALVVDKNGLCLTAGQARVKAKVDGRNVTLHENSGIWTAAITGLGEGDYTVRLCAEGSVKAETELTVRVTPGVYLQYNESNRSLQHGNKMLGPLSGSGHLMLNFRDVGSARERMVQGQKEWDAWDRSLPPGEHWHYWEAWTESELEQRFSYLEKCGWNILHLLQHAGLWEKLDVGGHLAPHGAEHLALLLRVAARHNLFLLQALTHYLYGYRNYRTTAGYTPPVRQYLEAGFQNEDWPKPNPGSPFNELFHNYLREFVGMFSEETALFAMSTSGEGDAAAGPDRVNDTWRFVTALDQNHIFLAEPIHRMNKLPTNMHAGWEPKLLGSRMYWMGVFLEPEIDLGIEFKLLQLGHYFMAEGSWPCPPLYARFANLEVTWAGTERYRTRVRDSFYLGLVHRCPIMLTWDEQCTEDERIILNEVRQLVDWNQAFRDAPVAIRVDDRVAPENLYDTASQQWRKIAAEYESCFSAMPLATRYLITEASVPSNAQAVFDAREPYRKPAFVSDGGTLPDALKNEMPLRISKGYRASYLWSEDKRTLVAYIYNCTHHISVKGGCLSGIFHRIPHSAPLNVTLHNLPGSNLVARIYDLNDKICLEKKPANNGGGFSPADSNHDYLLLIN